jgi:hypothetical protein
MENHRSSDLSVPSPDKPATFAPKSSARDLGDIVVFSFAALLICAYIIWASAAAHHLSEAVRNDDENKTNQEYETAQPNSPSGTAMEVRSIRSVHQASRRRCDQHRRTL